MRKNRRKQNWYVVQVTTGREDAMCATIERACREHDGAAEPGERIGLRECFSPKFQRRRKWKGEWQDIERAFLPGYVIAVTGNPAALAQALRGVREFCRVLAVEETYIPLAERERALLETHTGQPDRVIPLSFGCKAYAYFAQFVSFSPFKPGMGEGFCTIRLQEIAATGTNYLRGILGVHNDFLRILVEEGFLGFVFYIVYYVLVFPRRIERDCGSKAKQMFLICIAYAFIVYSTDNTSYYQVFQCALYLIITINVYQLSMRYNVKNEIT